MKTRVAVIAIIVENHASVAAINSLLHDASAYIVGRMGVPYRERGISLISVALDAPQDVISAMSGKIGNAVERNKIKRQTRMMCEELFDFKTFPYDVILIIRFGYKNLSYADNKKNLEKLVSKATMDRRIFNKQGEQQ